MRIGTLRALYGLYRLVSGFGNLIELLQALEHHLAQLIGLHGRKRTPTKLVLDIVDQAVQLLQIDIALRRGAHKTDEQLVAIEGLRGAVALDDGIPGRQ